MHKGNRNSRVKQNKTTVPFEGKQPSMVLVDEKIKRLKWHGNPSECDTYIKILEERVVRLRLISSRKRQEIEQKEKEAIYKLTKSDDVPAPVGDLHEPD